MSEVDQQRQQDLTEDVEMASIAEDELLNEKFSLQGTSTGKISGRKKVVSIDWIIFETECFLILCFLDS